MKSRGSAFLLRRLKKPTIGGMMSRAERSTDRNGRNGNASVAGHDVSSRIAGIAECARTYFG